MVAFFIGGSVPGYLGLSGLREAVSLSVDGLRIPGVIERFDCPRRSKSCRVVVTFKDPNTGAVREVDEGNASPTPDFVTGSPVDVLYLKGSNFERIRVNRPFYMWVMPLFMILMSAPCLAAAAYLMYAECVQRLRR